MARSIQSLSSRPMTIGSKHPTGMERIDTISRRLLHTLLRMQRRNLHHMCQGTSNHPRLDEMYTCPRPIRMPPSASKREIDIASHLAPQAKMKEMSPEPSGRMKESKTLHCYNQEVELHVHVKGVEIALHPKHKRLSEMERGNFQEPVYMQDVSDERVGKPTEVQTNIPIQDDLFSSLEQMSRSLLTSLESAEIRWLSIDEDTRVHVNRDNDSITIKITTTEALRAELLAEQHRIAESFTRYGFSINALLIQCSDHE